MLPLLTASVFAIFLFLICIRKFDIRCNKLIWGVFGSAFLLRLFLAFFTEGHTTDLNCFAAWANRIYTLGPSSFYSPEVFTDYPPGYMYILRPIGALYELFKLEYLSGLHILLLKLPSILCDMACGMLIYKKCTGHALFLSAAYLFNPAIILNSAIWGQVDSVFTLFLLVMCLSLMHKNTLGAYVSYGLGLLIKPQMLIFTPVLLVGIGDLLFCKEFSANSANKNLGKNKVLRKNLFQGLFVVGVLALLCLPFGLKNVISQYMGTLASYPYASVNAYNFYTLLGLNWVDQNMSLMGLPLTFIGLLVIFLIVVFCFILGKAWGDACWKYPLLCAFCILTMFTFSIRMHERYSYPALLCLLLAFTVSKDIRIYICYGIFSVLHLLNTAHVLYFYDPYNYDGDSLLMKFISLGAVVGMVYFYVCLRRLKGEVRSGIDLPAGIPSRSDASLLSGIPSLPGSAMSCKDIALLLAIMLIYSCFALYDLGDHEAPQTAHSISAGETLSFMFGEGEEPVSLAYYLAPWHDRYFELETRNALNETHYSEICLEDVFTWQSIELADSSITLSMTLKDSEASVLELVFLDASGNIIVPKNAADYPALFDEASLYPTRSSFRNSMYFDEIYHARTAYEFLNELTTYENTHPPLGKILIAAGVWLFGMNPFGWRIMGTLFGILMLPILYLFAKKITGNTAISALSCFLLAFDFMHFTQSRIATIDVYITFFVMLMYYFMYGYLEASRKKEFFFLGACGICMGLGIACKWSGAYAGVGLAILFFADLLRQYIQIKTISPNETAHKNFSSKTKKTICFCLVFFVLLPICIYVLSYLPFRSYNQKQGFFASLWENQLSMFDYHSSLNATHPYSSPWYQWPIMQMPIWYYSGIVSDTLREGISAFGNPLVWWVGIPASLYMIYLAIKKKDTTAGFLLVGYLSQYLPWFFVTRITFIYHYFPSIPFVILMIGYSLLKLKNSLSQNSFSNGMFSKNGFTVLLITYGSCVFLLFLLFYPVLSGQAVEIDFVEKYLRWFESWVLVAG